MKRSNMLVLAIRLYQNSSLVNTAVRSAIRIHHKLTPSVSRGPCTLVNCSGTGLAEAAELGFRALPGILSRINACGNICDETGIELPFCDKSLGINNGPGN
jgi:hypothetical protein